MARVAKILTTVFLAVLSLTKVNAQIEWVDGTPSIAEVGQMSITLNYGLKRSGVVYIVVFNYDNQEVLSSSAVRSLARDGASGNIVATSIRTIFPSNTNRVMQVTLEVRDPDQIHTIYVVAERFGFLQPYPVKLSATTLPCSPPNAGNGGTECDLNFVLNATFSSEGTGQWSMISGPGNAFFTPNPRTPDATVTVTAYGTYLFRWTVNNGECSGFAEVTVSFYQPPYADAGRGGNVCSDSFELSARPSTSQGTGTWTMTSGTGTAVFSPDANDPDAAVTVSEYGTKVFTWTVTNGPCSDESNVTVNFYEQPVADAGSGGDVCGLEVYLSASLSNGTGTWTRVSGPGSARFTPDANTPNASVEVSRYGDYVFRWTVDNGPCSASSTVSIRFLEEVAANAGNGGDECDREFQLNAVPGMGTGRWTMINGPGDAVFLPNPNQPDATVSVSQFGSYDFAWSEITANCSSVDVIRVVFHPPPLVDAGPDLSVCRGNSIQLQATGSGSFSWSPAGLLSNPLISNPVALPSETTVFTVSLTDNWGCANSDQIKVTVEEALSVYAGPDQDLGFAFETNLEADDLKTGETGHWSIISGSGDFEDTGKNNSHVSNLVIGVNTFIWTISNNVCEPATDTVNIRVSDLIIPSLITPNLDGKNDFFVINGLESLGRTQFIVFNRWGAQVYNVDEYKNDWDGKDENGYPLSNDTYYFILVPENTKMINGFIVIKR